MKYAIFDKKGLPKAFYDDAIHSFIPEEAIEITDEQWREFINNQRKRAWNFKTNDVIDISGKVWDGKQWRDRTEDEVLSDTKLQVLNQIASQTQSYIEKYYPDIKQRSDVADKEYWGAWLVDKGYVSNDIYKKCRNYAKEILEQTKTINNILTELPEGERLAWEQLIKVAVRVGWVQMCKEIYYQTKMQIEQAESVEEIQNVLNELNFPKYIEI